MKTNYRELNGMPKLVDALGIKSVKTDLNQRQKKAVRNIKACANDQWGWVCTWLDEHDQSARQLMMNPAKLFDTIYNESLTNVYDADGCFFGNFAEDYIKDIRFCGKGFLQLVTFYFVAKLLEESVVEVGGTEEDAVRVANELAALKQQLGI